MTDEGRQGDPMDEVETVKALGDMGVMVRAFYDGLREQEFTEAQALRLTAAWITGIAQSGT